MGTQLESGRLRMGMAVAAGAALIIRSITLNGANAARFTVTNGSGPILGAVLATGGHSATSTGQ
jgi:hypothetical protein